MASVYTQTSRPLPQGWFWEQSLYALAFCQQGIKEKKQILKCAKEALGLLINVSIFYEAPHAFNIKVFLHRAFKL